MGLLAVCLLASLSLSDYSAALTREVESQVAKVLGDREAADELSGTVSLVADDCFFLQGEEDAMKVVTDRAKPPVPGARVRVVGRPSLEGGRVVFVAEKVERTGASELPTPIAADGDDLIFVARTAADRRQDVNWRRVTIEGRAIGLTESGFAMEVDEVPVTVFTSQVPSFVRDCERMRPRLKVTGVPELILDQSSLFGRPRRVMGVKLHISSADDVTLEPDLLYYANRRGFWFQVAEVATILVLGLLLVVLAVFLLRQGRRQLKTKTIMQERKRMADDLHDTIEQHLVGAGMLLQLNKTQEAREILVRAKREIRDIVWGLKNDDMMRLTPADMIREYVKAENRKGVCRLDVHLAGLPEHLESAQMRDLSLIIRETVGNAIKHGGAKKIAISCDPKENGGWLMRLSNDGRPIDLEHAPGPQDGHFGVEGMKSRARRLGAELTISLRNGRTVVTIDCAKL